MLRTVQLCSIFARSSIRRLTYDLYREVVVAICSVVVFALFLHVFSDFVNTQVAQISHKLRETLGAWFGFAISGATSILAGKKLHAVRIDTAGIANFSKSIGEAHGIITAYRELEAVAIAISFNSPILWLCNRKFFGYSSEKALCILVGMIAITIVVGTFGRFASAGDARRKPTRQLLPELVTTPLQAMTRWRLGQILHRNRVAQLAITAGIMCALVAAFTSWRLGPPFAGILASFTAGNFVASAVAFQLADDLDYAWMERSLGVSHELYVAAIKRTAMYLSFPLSLFSGLSWFAFALVRQGFATETLSLSIKIFVVGLTSAWILPATIFQIDARRPLIQIVIVFIISLFLATAVFAHWLGILLIPLFVYYAAQSQTNRFYRA